MQKTIPIFTLAAFLAGAILGHSGLFASRTETKESTTSARDTLTNGRAAGLKLVRNDGSGKQALPSGNTLTSYLLKYAEFSPQETRAELDRLLKAQKENKKYDYALYQSIQYLALKLGEQSPEETKRILEEENTPIGHSLYSSLLEGWAEKDFSGAMGFLLSHKKDKEGSSEIFKTLTTNLTNQDPDRAIKWISTLTPGERGVALDILSGNIPRLHPEKTKEFLATLTPGELSSYSVISKLSANWSVSDWDSFKAWSETLKENKKESVLSSAFSKLAEVNLDKATEEFKKTDKKNRREIATSIIDGMVYEEKIKGKGLDWVMENKESFSNLPDMVESAMRSTWSWDGITPQLKDKVLNLPEGELRDSAVSGLINSQNSISISGDYQQNSNEKYTNLLSLSEKIGDPQKRNDIAQRCVEEWIERVPEKARQWITEKSQFSDEIKKKLYQKCDNIKKDA